MKAKKILTKAISLLLALLICTSILISCTSEMATNPDASAQATANGSESESSTASDTVGVTDIITVDVTESGTTISTEIPSESYEVIESEIPTESESASETTSSAITGIVLWADGEYQAKVIRAEMADDFTKTFYNDFRALVKKRVVSTTQPALTTDFVPYGKEQYDGPAILIGETNFAESKAVYKTLKSNQAKAVVSGDKYVIAYSSEMAAIELLEKLKDLLNKKGTKQSIVINSAWQTSLTIKGFDESTLGNSASLPSPTGFSWAVQGRDAGHGSQLYISKSANLSAYTQYCTALRNAGFTFYTSNDTLHTNKFSTYVTKTQIVHLMFFAPQGVIKMVIDPRSTFGLPGLASENIYTQSTAATEFIQLGLKQISGSSENGMGYIVKLTNGKFVVVDGGFAYDTGGGGNSATFILDTLKKLQGNSSKKPVIAAWIVTHIHTDHAGGFMGMANKHANDVVIEKLIYNQPSDAQMNSVSNMSGRKNWIPSAITKLKNAGSLQSVVKAHPGMQFFFADLTITILGTIDVIENASYQKMSNGNNSSVVSMFEMNGGKVLLTGDCEPLEGRNIRDIYGGITNKTSPLKADFIQIAHHGYGNTNTDNNYQGGNDQNALNVMASGGGTSAGSSPIYALVPVGLANGKEPAGYYDAVKNMDAMRIFSEDHRLVAYNKNMTIKFNKNGTQTIEKTKHDGFWIGTWTTY